MKRSVHPNVSGTISSLCDRSRQASRRRSLQRCSSPNVWRFSNHKPIRGLHCTVESSDLYGPAVCCYGRSNSLVNDFHGDRLKTSQSISWKKPLISLPATQWRKFSSSSHVPQDDEGTLPKIAPHESHSSSKEGEMRYIIALGSNMGDKFDMIERACLAMDKVGIRVTCTSGLWQTRAMYVEEQDDFLNGVCMVRTGLDPISLMQKLQTIENELGRVKVIDKGPRSIDLDILLWEKGSFCCKTPDLTIPHKLMHEREFVLAPLSQIVGSSFDTHSGLDDIPAQFIANEESRTFYTMLRQLQQQQSADSPKMRTQTSYSKTFPALVPSHPRKPTHTMAILNLTPDSFSDGGKHAYDDPGYLRSTILSHLHAGATIIDLGGQSSRPGALDISAEEEIARITPALQILACLREDKSMLPFAISVDTYRASVAEAAVRLGADIVNDISAGTLDPDMLPTVARLGCTYVLMHMRGTPATMSNKQNTTYTGDLIQDIKAELTHHLIRAQKAGIRRWRIILDPGVGFAKVGAQNTEILRRLPELMASDLDLLGRADGIGKTKSAGKGIVHDGAFYNLDGIPWLVGTSRKRFIGNILGVDDALHRQWGTAATVAASVAGGADIVRVHDVQEMVQVARMSDAIWRV